MAKFKLDIKKPDMAAVTKMVAATYQYGFREGFRTGGGMTDDSEGGWKPSAGAGKVKYNTDFNEKKGFYSTTKTTKKTLVLTGKLRQSIKAKVLSSTKVLISTNVVYAAIHNKGGRIYRNPEREGHQSYFINMPKREFIGDSRRIQGRVVRKLKTAVKKALLNR
jgi:phage gpG-like protein